MNILIKSLFIAFLFTVNAPAYANIGTMNLPSHNLNEDHIKELAKTEEMKDLAEVLETTPEQAIRDLFEVKTIVDEMLANFYLSRQLQDPGKAAQTVVETKTRLEELRKRFKREETLQFIFNNYVQESTGENVDLYTAIMRQAGNP